MYTIHEHHIKNTCSPREISSIMVWNYSGRQNVRKCVMQTHHRAFLIAHIRKWLNTAPFCLSFSQEIMCGISCVDAACSCKINSCIFKRDANESAWWTGLLARNLITSVVPFAKWVYFSSQSVSFFFPFALFHFACPLQPIMRVHVMNSKYHGVTAREEK